MKMKETHIIHFLSMQNINLDPTINSIAGAGNTARVGWKNQHSFLGDVPYTNDGAGGYVGAKKIQDFAAPASGQSEKVSVNVTGNGSQESHRFQIGIKGQSDYNLALVSENRDIDVRVVPTNRLGYYRRRRSGGANPSFKEWGDLTTVEKDWIKDNIPLLPAAENINGAEFKYRFKFSTQELDGSTKLRTVEYTTPVKFPVQDFYIAPNGKDLVIVRQGAGNQRIDLQLERPGACPTNYVVRSIRQSAGGTPDIKSTTVMAQSSLSLKRLIKGLMMHSIEEVYPQVCV